MLSHGEGNSAAPPKAYRRVQYYRAPQRGEEYYSVMDICVLGNLPPIAPFLDEGRISAVTPQKLAIDMGHKSKSKGPHTLLAASPASRDVQRGTRSCLARNNASSPTPLLFTPLSVHSAHSPITTTQATRQVTHTASPTVHACQRRGVTAAMGTPRKVQHYQEDPPPIKNPIRPSRKATTQQHCLKHAAGYAYPILKEAASMVRETGGPGHQGGTNKLQQEVKSESQKKKSAWEGIVDLIVALYCSEAMSKGVARGDHPKGKALIISIVKKLVIMTCLRLVFSQIIRGKMVGKRSHLLGQQEEGLENDRNGVAGDLRDILGSLLGGPSSASELRARGLPFIDDEDKRTVDPDLERKLQEFGEGDDPEERRLFNRYKDLLIAKQWKRVHLRRYRRYMRYGIIMAALVAIIVINMLKKQNRRMKTTTQLAAAK